MVVPVETIETLAFGIPPLAQMRVPKHCFDA